MIPPRILALACTVLFATVACSPKTLPTRAPVPASPLTLGDGEWRVVDQVVVITDASGTQYMNETFPEAKALTQGFVAGMPGADSRSKSGHGGYTAGSIGFGGDDRITAPVAPFNRGALASKADSLHIMGDVHQMGGTTPLHDVFYEVQHYLGGKRGGAAVVLFSDGMPDDAEGAFASAYALAKSVPDGICFHTVQTGADPVGKAFLENLASITSCGTYRGGNSVDNPAGMANFERAVFAAAAPTLPAVAAGPCEARVELRGVEFAFDSADLQGASAVVLDVVVEHLTACPGVSVRVGGHTDSMGSDGYNQGLSDRRARSVRGYLIDKGIDGGRLSAEGFGESRPLDSNDTRDGRARNRRVELTPR